MAPADRPPPGVTHRFFLPSDSLASDDVSFPPDLSHQIARVLRLDPGDEVIVLDGSGVEATVCLETVRPIATGKVVARAPSVTEPATPVVLYMGLLKAAKLEMVLQKGTEIGLVGFVPMVTARSVAGEPSASRQKRFEAIVREAAEQSRRGMLPFVAPPIPFAEAVRSAAGTSLLLWEEEEQTHLMNAPLKEHPVSLFVGPEGGFTTEEAALAREAGMQIVTLGPRILRAETAGIVAGALLLARLGDLG